MTTLIWHDRSRFETAVWAFDRQLQDLPRRSHIAKRRELRDNQRSATADVGAAVAVRQLGDPRRLAAGYLAAEYGDWQTRPSWSRTAARRPVLPDPEPAFGGGQFSVPRRRPDGPANSHRQLPLERHPLPGRRRRLPLLQRRGPIRRGRPLPTPA